MLERGNTYLKSVSREWMVVVSIRVRQERILCNSNAVASKGVHSMGLESVNNKLAI